VRVERAQHRRDVRREAAEAEAVDALAALEQLCRLPRPLVPCVGDGVVDERAQQPLVLAREETRLVRAAPGAQHDAAGGAGAQQRRVQGRERRAHARLRHLSVAALEQLVHFRARLRVTRHRGRAEARQLIRAPLRQHVEPAERVGQPLLLEHLDVHLAEPLDERVARRAARARELAQLLVRVKVQALGTRDAQQPAQAVAPVTRGFVRLGLGVGHSHPAVRRERREP